MADDSKESMVTGDECKDSTGIGDARCGDTVIGLGVNYEVNPLIIINKLIYLEILTSDDGSKREKSLSILITHRLLF
jgi:hypothetical protein